MISYDGSFVSRRRRLEINSNAAASNGATDTAKKVCPRTYKAGIANAFAENICKNCSLLALSLTADSSENTTVVNKDYLILQPSSYTDNIYYPKVFDSMLTPPVPLLQGYKFCTASNLNAATSAAGISWSNTALLMGIATLIFLSLWKLLWNSFLSKRFDNSRGVMNTEEKMHVFQMSVATLLAEIVNPSYEGHMDKCRQLLMILGESVNFDSKVYQANENGSQRASILYEELLKAVKFTVLHPDKGKNEATPGWNGMESPSVESPTAMSRRSETSNTNVMFKNSGNVRY